MYGDGSSSEVFFVSINLHKSPRGEKYEETGSITSVTARSVLLFGNTIIIENNEFPLI